MCKSILVIDTPKNCDYCPVGRIFGMAGQVECMASKDICINQDGRIIPDWCPLKELPQKKEARKIRRNNLQAYYISKFDMGYNACIDEFFREVFDSPTEYNGDNIGGRD